MLNCFTNDDWFVKFDENLMIGSMSRPINGWRVTCWFLSTSPPAWPPQCRCAVAKWSGGSKPTQLPPLAIRVSGDLQMVGFKKSDVITSSIPTTPPWLLTHPVVNFSLHCSDKSNTPTEMFRHSFFELCDEFKNYYRIFTDGSKEGNKVAAAVVYQDNTKCVRLPDTASIFRAILLECALIHFIYLLNYGTEVWNRSRNRSRNHVDSQV